MSDDAKDLPHDVLRSATRYINNDSPETVIGHRRDNYLDVARRSTHHANHFDIGPDWDDLSPDQQWAANQLVLDHTISRAHVVRLATRRSEIRSGSGLDREVSYLLSRGYRYRTDRDEDLYLVPPTYPAKQPPAL